MSLSVERVVSSSRLADGEFDAPDHPQLNVWLQSRAGHCRVSVGYLGKIPVRLYSCRGYRVIHDFKQERAMNYVIFEESEASLRRAFATVVAAAWERSLESDSPEASLTSFLVAVRDLKQLFGRSRLGFSAEELRGLMAELLTIQRLIDSGGEAERVLAGWKAPTGSVRDFVFSATHSLEVKSARPDSGTITVSSVSQLDQEDHGLQLVVWPLVETNVDAPGSVCFAEILSDLRSKCSYSEYAIQHLEEAIIVLGLMSSEEELKDVAFSYGECATFDVKDDFPRIRSGDIADQIRDVSYTLRTADLAKFAAGLALP